MPRESDARQKMVESAAVLFRERGVQGTSFADVIAHSGAPRGSIYHHFRGGKTQLAEEATRWAGEFIVASTVAALAEKDPVAAIESLRRWWAGLLRDSDYAAGCVVVAATLEGEREPTLRALAADAFSAWTQVLAGALGEHDVPTARSRSIATLVVAAIEGAVVMSRAQRNLEPLRQVSEELQALVVSALAEGAPSTPLSRAGRAP